jgi:hypothetical protein
MGRQNVRIFWVLNLTTHKTLGFKGLIPHEAQVSSEYAFFICELVAAPPTHFGGGGGPPLLVEGHPDLPQYALPPRFYTEKFYTD